MKTKVNGFFKPGDRKSDKLRHPLQNDPPCIYNCLSRCLLILSKFWRLKIDHVVKCNKNRKFFLFFIICILYMNSYSWCVKSFWVLTYDAKKTDFRKCENYHKLTYFRDKPELNGFDILGPKMIFRTHKMIRRCKGFNPVAPGCDIFIANNLQLSFSHSRSG